MFASVGEDLLRAVLQGAPPGTVYALVALGFVLAYKTSGVFNLAFGAQAYVSAVVFFKTHVEWEWGVLPSFLISVVVLAPLLGVLLEFLVFRHLRTRPPVSGLVVAIGLTLALPALVDVVLGYQPRGGQTPEGLADRGNSVFYEVLGVYSFSRNELVAMAAAQGPAIGAYATILLDNPLPWTKMRQVYALLGLAKKWGPDRVDAACGRAAEAEAFNVGLIGRMLERGAETAPPETVPQQSLLPGRFARPASDFATRKEASA